MSDNRYYHDLTDVIAFTLDEVVLHGIKSGAHLYGGMPWSFNFATHPVTHENDNVYLIGGMGEHMTHKDMLVIETKNIGNFKIVPMEEFIATYEAMD